MSGWVAGLGYLHGRPRRHEHEWVEMTTLGGPTAQLTCTVPGCGVSRTEQR